MKIESMTQAKTTSFYHLLLILVILEKWEILSANGIKVNSKLFRILH